MAEIKLPEIRPANSVEGKVESLTDAYFMLRKYMMYYLSGNLDSDNVIEAATVKADWVYAGTLVANQINAVQGIVLGDNATISWSCITDADTYSLDAWEASGYATHIDANGVYTGTLTANQINAIQGITLGANATISWADLPSLPTASQVGALPSSTYIPTTADITTITANYVSTPNLYTNIARVANSLSLGSGSADGTLTFRSGASIYSFDTINGPYIAFDVFGLQLGGNDVSCSGNWHFSSANASGLENSGYAKTSDIAQAIAAHIASYHT